MNRSELISVVAAKTGFTKKDTEKIIISAYDTVTDALLRNETVKITGFGTFEVCARKARTVKDFKTNTAVTSAPTKAVRFKPGKRLGDISVKCRESEEK